MASHSTLQASTSTDSFQPPLLDDQASYQPRDAFIEKSFQVPFSVDFLSGLVERFPRLFQWLGNLETASLNESLATVNVDRPIFIAGMARSGSTILLEALSHHAETVTHRYCDFPLVHVPVWWNRAQQRTKKGAAAERAHGDGIRVTADSPEAMEEVLWQSFFDHLHNPKQNQVLDGETTHEAFERFYRDHIRKLLWLRSGGRYLSKGNYNFSRLAYLQRLFPDARFIVPVRRPEAHLASLIKQHRLFTLGETRYPRALRHMQRVGHYEFGLDRRPIHTGDFEGCQSVLDLWNQGQELRGWARYWSQLYGWMADQLQANDELRQATLVIRYEDLCDDAELWLNRIADHCQLQRDDTLRDFGSIIHAPTYYEARFTDEEQSIIEQETGPTTRRYYRERGLI